VNHKRVYREAGLCPRRMKRNRYSSLYYKTPPSLARITRSESESRGKHGSRLLGKRLRCFRFATTLTTG